MIAIVKVVVTVRLSYGFGPYLGTWHRVNIIGGGLAETTGAVPEIGVGVVSMSSPIVTGTLLLSHRQRC